jgi:hypothetical protein
MPNRYFYIKPWDLLQVARTHEDIVEFSAKLALAENCGARVCVNQKNACGQYIAKAFDENAAKRLLKNESVKVSGVSFTLDSIVTLKHDYAPQKAVYLVFFPTVQLLAAVENLKNSASIIVFSETEEPDDLAEWRNKYSPQELSFSHN